MLNTHQVQHVQEPELWSVGKTVGVAVLTAVGGTLFPIVQHFLLGNLPRLQRDILSMLTVVLLFVLLATVLIGYHRRLQHWYHAVVFGFVYGYAVPMITIAVQVISMGLVPMVVVVRGLSMSCVPGVISAVLALAVWTASRLSRGRLIVAFTPCCPRCGYNLTGNTNRICPECGVPFTLEELRITEEALQPGRVFAGPNE